MPIRFQKGLSCSHIIYSLKQVADYFTIGGSTVNICTLDINKAFDKVNYYVLMLKLAERRFPAAMLNIFASWFDCSYAIVKWGEHKSVIYQLESGVRQGSVISPHFFAIYVNDVLHSLSESKLGCRIRNVACCCFMYADDLIILTASLTDLQALIDICVAGLSIIGLDINAKKTSFIRVGKKFKYTCANLTVNSVKISSSLEIRCLGVYLCSGLTLKFSFDHAKHKFYGVVNCILSRVGNKPDIVIALCNAQCLPILLYCTEAMLLNKTERIKIAHSHFRLFAKLFHTFNKEIVDQCMYYMNCLPLQYVIDLRVMKFLDKIARCNNVVLNMLYRVFGEEAILNVQERHNIARRSVKSWRLCMWDSFVSDANIAL